MKEKYKVLLVDDESDVAHVISRKLNWNELGFQEPIICGNGLEALEEAEKDRPDVVMTDITMPYMTGLELARKLKDEYPNIRIIIFSGYDEFEYAQEAIHIQAEEYILKPIDADKLKDVFIRIKEGLDKEVDAQQNMSKLESYYKDSLPTLQESFYTALMENKIPSDKLDYYITNYSIELNSHYYCVVIFHVSTHTLKEEMNPLYLSISVRKLAEEKLSEKWKGKFFNYQDNVVMIAQMDESKDIKELTDDCDKFTRLCESVVKAVVTIGLGNVCDSIIDISRSYEGARLAISYRALYGTTKAINIDEIEPEKSTKPLTIETETLNEVFKRIRIYDRKSLDEAIDAFLNETTSTLTKVPEFRFYVMQLVSEMYSFASENKLELDELFTSYHDIIMQVEKLELKDLNTWMHDLCHKMQDMINVQRTNTTKNFIIKAMDYVSENYSDSTLTAESLCNYLNVSYAYFSTVFRKETGKTFTTYLTETRMNKAVDLLLNQNEKTYIIAHDVGYTDPNYFSYVFKKTFGVSPNHYKQKAENKSE